MYLDFLIHAFYTAWNSDSELNFLPAGKFWLTLYLHFSQKRDSAKPFHVNLFLIPGVSNDVILIHVQLLESALFYSTKPKDSKPSSVLFFCEIKLWTSRCKLTCFVLSQDAAADLRKGKQLLSPQQHPSETKVKF